MLLFSKAEAQYISLSETVPFTCPVVCTGGSFTVKIFQVQRLPNGSEVQAELSDANGIFGAGSQNLSVAAYSTNGGTNYTNGPYTFRGDVSDLMARFIIPAGTLPGTGYNMRIRSSSGYHSSDNFRCPGQGHITVVAGSSPLPPVTQTTSGDGQWVGHIYTWVPTTAGPINTPTLVDAQHFFDSVNYKGHARYDSLSLDISFSTTGGVPGSAANGSSFTCGSNAFVNNYAMRLKRRQNFSPGRYNFSIAGDDGIRMSTDGGATWLLDSWQDQEYVNSTKTTATANPNGLCLNGPLDLVIEYFQHPADARLTFKVTPFNLPVSPPQNTVVCEGAGRAQFQSGSTDPGNQYQWQVSTDNGATFTNITDGPGYSGVTTANMQVLNPGISMAGYQYRMVLSNTCVIAQPSAAAMLNVIKKPYFTNRLPADTTVCPGSVLSFGISAENAAAYQWQENTGAGFADINGNVSANQPVFNLASVAPGSNGYKYRVRLTANQPCTDILYSDPIEIRLSPLAELTGQPQDWLLCTGAPAIFSVSAANTTNYQWQADTGTGYYDINPAMLPGAQTRTLTIPAPAEKMAAWHFRCVVSNIGCTATAVSNSAGFNRQAAPIINLQPANQTICEGDTIVFAVSSTQPVSYRWQSDTGSGFTDINTSEYTGANTATLRINAPKAAMEGYRFRSVVANIPDCGPNTISEAVSLNRLPPPVISVQPVSLVLCRDSSARFTVSSLQGGIKYGWQISINNGSTWADLSNSGLYSGAQSNTLIVNNLPEGSETAMFRAVLSQECGDGATSAPADLSRCCVVQELTNIITPNGDGNNDRFGTYSCSFTAFSLQVFNRWGKLIYK
ncbi:MAG: gliding motility-associated C-terminal domain-containing protein, partial [Bacteroidota bacterium]